MSAPRLGPRGTSGVLLVALSACQSGSPSETACPDAQQRLGHRVCIHQVPDKELWSAITFPAAAVDQARATTYLVPAREGARLPPLLVDATAFEMPEQSLHHRFLTESFPEFASLEYEEYLELVRDPGRREWFAGSITEFLGPSEDPLLGFTVYDQATEASGTVTCDQLRTIHGILEGRIGFGTTAVVPSTDLQREVLAECDVPWHDPSTALDYEVYTRASGCGTLRRYTLEELAQAELEAEFGWQDVLVVDQAPADIETIVSGIVTGTRQGELSHLNVRSASRGTPNCYVKDAHALLESWQGQLVQLECGAAGATVVEITPQQAQECWDGLRPDPVEVPVADLSWTELVPLLEAPTDSADERRTNVGRFGAKGANLATLYQRIDPDLQLEGFLVPFHYYDAFMRSGTWSVDLGAGPESLSFHDTIDRLLDDESFVSDGAVRRERLLALSDAMRATACDPELLLALEDQILAIFGSDEVMVRFRSSSNAEDALDFNGAGLYDSTSACLADQTDGDDAGPSRCDPQQSSERDLCRALTTVWASLWNMKAYEERAWYGIDHRQIAMGILVNTRTPNELANIVAFSGNPLLRGDDRYLVNAQAGELDVVSALPGIWPEKNLLTLEQGQVTAIERARGSTLLPEGQWVLDDARLEQLGAQLWSIVEVYPIDEQISPTASVLLDTEWKLRSDGRLAIKQIRPFVE